MRRCDNCEMLKTIYDEFDREYVICTCSQSSYFLQEVDCDSECDLTDEDMIGSPYNKENETDRHLLNCPCCGGEAELFYEKYSDVAWVQCTECGLSTSKYRKTFIVDDKDGEERAIMRWNTRINENLKLK